MLDGDLGSDSLGTAEHMQGETGTRPLCHDDYEAFLFANQAEQQRLVGMHRLLQLGNIVAISPRSFRS